MGSRRGVGGSQPLRNGNSGGSQGWHSDGTPTALRRLSEKQLMALRRYSGGTPTALRRLSEKQLLALALRRHSGGTPTALSEGRR